MARSRGLRKRHWVFTSFLDDIPSVFDPDIVRYVVYQREICPISQKKHYQGYIEFFNNLRINQVKAILGECHLEERKGPREKARDYARKEATAIKDTQVEWGSWRSTVHKRKLADILGPDVTYAQVARKHPAMFVRYHRGINALMLERIREKAQDRRRVVCYAYCGPTGTGKTTRALEEHKGEDVYVLPACKNLWFDGYTNQKILVIDDFCGQIKYLLLLRICDGHRAMFERKGGFVWALWTTVIFTSNKLPCQWYKGGISPPLRRRLPVANVIWMGDAANPDPRIRNYVADLDLTVYSDNIFH